MLVKGGPDVWRGDARSHKTGQDKMAAIVQKAFSNWFLYENTVFFIRLSPKFIPDSPIYNNTKCVQMMASCPIGDESLSESMMV